MPSLVILLPALIIALLTTSSVSAQTAGLRALASNPLLRGLALPRYAEISHEHFAEAVQHLLDLSAEKIAAIEQDETIDFASLFDALGEIDIYFNRIWTPIAHLHMVRNDKELGEEFRAAYEAAQLQVVELGLQLAQNPVIYGKLLVLAEDDSLDAVQQHLVQLRLDSAQQQGVGLAAEERERFNAITDELATLGTRFANHILDATKDFQLILRDKSEIAGLPASFLAQVAQSYQQATGDTASAEAGPWRITLDYPIYKEFMGYSERRDLREQLYRARLSIAAREPYDNTPLVQRILQLRQEKAQLLGFPHHAALVLSNKMADNVDDVKQLLDELHEVGYANFLTEQAQLNAYAAAQGETEKLTPWDVAFWARKMKEELFDLDTEALRQYFPLPRVLDGLFGLLNKMFGISIVKSTAGVQVWHADVEFYDVRDTDGTHIASFYFDPYSRPQDKAGGAWKSTCNSRHVSSAGVEMPVCHVVTNFAPPTDDVPALLTMQEVEMLFHEFGHAMHELLTTVDYGEIAGTRVERDAVEMPSKFMENFVFLDRVIPTISAHVTSGEPLPTEMLARLRELKNFRIASQLQRQLFYSYLDLQLHSDFDPDTQDSLALMREIHQHTLAVLPIDTDRFINSFRHIFAGGYHANYYSYKWGEVLATDAFAMFVENGFDDENLQRSGRMFRDIVLATGGSKPARDIYIELRGRLPSSQALLKSYGLVE